ncbi:MAG: hypothetical protein PEPC_01697 [Peptostreptococcus russellii]
MKIEDALKEYKYANIGQARAIAAELGYNEECNRGFLRFSTKDDEYKTSFDSIRAFLADESEEEREALQDKSWEAVCRFFDKEKAEDSFEQYKEYLREAHNISIVKWKDLKAGNNFAVKGQSPDGFTIIDHERKVCYTGKSLYEFAQGQQLLLDGTGTKLEEGVMSELTTVKSKPAKVRLQNGELRVYNRKEALVIPSKILGKKLTPAEKEILRRGEILPITSKGTHLFCQVDRDLNSVIVLTDKEIKIPDIIGATEQYQGYKLTTADKFLLANSKSLDNIILHSKDGFIIADLSISEDKKGVVFTNIQNITENKAREIIRGMEKSKEEEVVKGKGIEVVNENGIQAENTPVEKLTSLTPDEKTYLYAVVHQNNVFPDAVPAFMKDRYLTREEMQDMKTHLGIDDSNLPSIDYNTATNEEINSYEKKFTAITEHVFDLLELPLDLSPYGLTAGQNRTTVSPDESLFIHSVLNNNGNIGIYNSYMDGHLLNFDAVKEIGVSLGFEPLIVEREYLLFLNGINYLEDDRMKNSLGQLNENVMELAHKLKNLPLDFSGVDIKIGTANIARSAITPEENSFLHRLLLSHNSFPEYMHISGELGKDDYLDLIKGLGLFDNYTAFKQMANDPDYSGNRDLQAELDGVMESTINEAKQLLTLPVRDLELELKEAVRRNDFEKIAQLQEDGFKPSDKVVRGLNKEGNLSDLQCIAIEKIFGVKPDLPEVQNLEMKEKSGELTAQEEKVFSPSNGSMDREMIEAVLKDDFIKLGELKEQGYVPSPDVINSLGEKGLSQNTMIAVQKIFDLKGQNKTLGDVKLAHDAEHEKDISRPIAQTVNQAFANL